MEFLQEVQSESASGRLAVFTSRIGGRHVLASPKKKVIRATEKKRSKK